MVLIQISGYCISNNSDKVVALSGNQIKKIEIALSMGLPCVKNGYVLINGIWLSLMKLPSQFIWGCCTWLMFLTPYLKKDQQQKS